ncbi:hypothetical protein AX27061_5328 [Achromobacter xylosoxidans NBRC 15126 = ATCC 27061]|nr:hypothetical protein AX27061_5328 [Achromobacter xylosoxidans NBRC 15126 = ATCC 27061]
MRKQYGLLSVPIVHRGLKNSGVALGVLVFNRGGTSPRSGVQRCPRIYSPTSRSGRPNRLRDWKLSDGGACSCWSSPPAASSGGGSTACKARRTSLPLAVFLK